MTRQLIQAWESYLRASSRAEETIKLRTAHVSRCLREIALPLHEITADHFIDWLAAHEWAPATRRSHRASIVGFVNWASARGHMDATAGEIPATRVPRGMPRPAADPVILAALRAADPRVQLMIELMTYGGLRRGEVSRVKAGDLTGEWLRVVGKGGHVRIVPLPPHLCARIRAHAGWLFPGAIDGHLSARRVGELIREVLPRDVTPHQLRHRYATTVYSHSGDIRAVQKLLGHAKLETTAIYVDVSDRAQRVAAAGAWGLAS